MPLSELGGDIRIDPHRVSPTVVAFGPRPNSRFQCEHVDTSNIQQAGLCVMRSEHSSRLPKQFAIAQHKKLDGPWARLRRVAHGSRGAKGAILLFRTYSIWESACVPRPCSQL